MSSLSISSTFSDLFSAPLDAVVKAEESYLQLWIARLTTIQAVYVKSNKLKGDVSLQDLIAQYVPVIQLEGNISTSITMRIAGVREKSGSINVGLSLGPIHSTGGFGFSSRKTEESIFQASTDFVISNKEFSLQGYLKAAKLPLATPADLKNAIKHLQDDLKNRPDTEDTAAVAVPVSG